MEKVIINPYNIGQLDSKIKPLGNRIDLYFDYVKSDFTAMVYHDSKNRAKVYYSKCQARSLTDEAKAMFPDFSDRLDAMIASCVQNYIASYLDGGEIFKQIVEVEYIPELRGLNFKTAGYVIGNTCAVEVYAKGNTDGVVYIINNQAYNIDGETLTTIAARYLVKDIEDCNSLGYLYYNRTRPTKNAKGDDIKVAIPNDRRFGAQTSIRGVSNLMRNFTSFIPIGFRWSVYKPIIMQNEEFVRKLKDETILGLDMVEIPNLTFDGMNIQDYDSVTFYTTRKRLHQVLNETFENYNFRFFNELVTGLFLNGNGYTHTGTIAINRNNDKKFILGIAYEGLNEDEKAIYAVAKNEKCAMIAAEKLVKMYWDTMNSTRSEISRELVSSVAKLSMESIISNNTEEAARSTQLFGYVV